jgi:hypothetical protein
MLQVHFIIQTYMIAPDLTNHVPLGFMTGSSGLTGTLFVIVILINHAILLAQPV